MAIPANTARVVLHGHLGGGEIFETGFWLTTDSGMTGGNYDDLVSAIAASFVAHNSNFRGAIPADCGYDRVILYAYPTGGPDADSVHEFALDTQVGTASSANGWAGLSAVLTLLTGFAGRSKRGRMYIPCVALSVQDGLFVSDNESGIISDAVAWFNGINGIEESGPRVVVMSDVLSTTSNVESLRLTDKPGGQRRREGDIVPAHVHTEALA